MHFQPYELYIYKPDAAMQVPYLRNWFSSKLRQSCKERPCKSDEVSSSYETDLSYEIFSSIEESKMKIHTRHRNKPRYISKRWRKNKHL